MLIAALLTTAQTWKQCDLPPARGKHLRTSGQDGGAGRHTAPLCTTKRTTTNVKARNNHNCQKIKLYGSPTTKELKKKHSSIPVGGAEMVVGWRGLAARWRLEHQAAPHLCVDEPGGTIGKRDIPHTQGSS